MKIFKQLSTLPIIVLLSGCATTGSGLAERPDVHAFIQNVAVKDQFNESQLNHLFNQVYVHPMFAHNESAPKEHTLLWDHYRAIFLTQDRANEGATFLAQHQSTFNQEQQTYGVSPQVVSSIIGVETRYGKFLGKYRVMDSLTTLAFNYPPRKEFFQDELEQYLLLTRDLNVDPLSLYGSYAGAVGLPQFMPDSYRHLAVSEVKGATPDLWHNPDDAILSVGNFFHEKGWEAGQPIAVPAQVIGNKYTQLDIDGMQTKYTVAQLKAYGIKPKTYLPPETPVNLLILPTAHGQEYWLAGHNFYVITRYNTSDYYAMAVYELSDAIQQQYQRQIHT